MTDQIQEWHRKAALEIADTVVSHAATEGRYPSDERNIASIIAKHDPAAELHRQVEALCKALSEYGKHNPVCAYEIDIYRCEAKLRPCDCGLDKALSSKGSSDAKAKGP